MGDDLHSSGLGAGSNRWSRPPAGHKPSTSHRLGQYSYQGETLGLSVYVCVSVLVYVLVHTCV